jgi:subtilisin family serine protease
LEVFIKAGDSESAREAISNAGGVVHTQTGNVLTASISESSLDILSSSDAIEFIEAGKPVSALNDVAKVEINTIEVQTGATLPTGYTGKGVIVGIIDTGIDYSHPDFLDANGKSRVLSIWSQTRSQGPSPKEIENSYGTECDSDSLSNGNCPLRDIDGHGTHVSGTAAGDDETYGGVAPDANIIVVSYDSSMDLGSGYAETLFSTKICQAAYYIFKKAEALGMPAVINMSLGTHIGAHDGSSLFEQCLSGLLKDSAGKAIVAAAGNEFITGSKYTGIHAGAEVDGSVAANFVIRKITSDKLYYIDLWGSKGSDLSVGLAMHNGTPKAISEKYSGLVKMGDQTSGTFLDGDIEYSINFTEAESSLNGKPHAGILLKLKSSSTEVLSRSFDLVVSGSGSFDAWLFPDKPSNTVQFTSAEGSLCNDWTHIKGDSLNTVAIPATHPDIIAVGAYTTRNHWDRSAGCCNVSFTLGDILPFSSSGPTSDPDTTGVKPDISAPGAMIASTLSSSANVGSELLLSDGLHALEAGTSMAAPFVTGAIALMFSADSNFTYLDVKKYIQQSAYSDEHVGEVPNSRWGYGKLDVLAAVETAVNGGASGAFESNTSLSDVPDVGGASSGCSLHAQGDGDRHIPTLLIMFSMVVLVSFRKIDKKI